MTRHLFILGAMKSGTTLLYNCLRQHPEICMSIDKEPRFFELDNEYYKGIEYYYNEYFDHYSGEMYRGDARPLNLYLPWVAQRIYSCYPNAKLLVILRDPVKRAFSHYWHWRWDGVESCDFEVAINKDFERIAEGFRYQTEKEKKKYQKKFCNGRGPYRSYIDLGYYAEQIERFIDIFSREQLMILRLKKFLKDIEKKTNEVFGFLELSQKNNIQVSNPNPGKAFYLQSVQDIVYQIHRGRKKRKFPHILIPHKLISLFRDMNTIPKSEKDIPPIVERWLYNHFEDQNEKLNDILKDEVSWGYSKKSKNWNEGYHFDLI